MHSHHHALPDSDSNYDSNSVSDDDDPAEYGCDERNDNGVEETEQMARASINTEDDAYPLSENGDSGSQFTS